MKTRCRVLKQPLKSSSTAMTCLVFAVLAVAGPGQAAECLKFQGIEHCPVGKATLSSSSDGLTVQNEGGLSGVSSRFSPTVHWNARMQFNGDKTFPTTALASISGGETTSRLLIEPDGDNVRIRATFTGASKQPTYSVLVYKDGTLQGALGKFDGRDGGDIGSGTTSVKPDKTDLPDRPPRPGEIVRPIRLHDGGVTFSNDIFWWWDWWWWWDWAFFISPSGGCNWTLSMMEAVSVRLPDGRVVVGDELRFSEDIPASGHYPYLGFESIETVSVVPKFTITKELAEGTH